MRLRSPDLVLVAIFLSAAIAVILPPVSDPVPRIVIGIPFVLFLPGYALSVAIAPHRALGEVERGVLSVGLSVSLAALGGLVLHWTPWGLRAESWLALLGGTCWVACVVALVRRGGTGRVPYDPRSGSNGAPPVRGLPLPRVREAVLLASAVLVGSAALWTSTAGALQQREGFTQLWLLPADDGSGETVRIGVRSMELDGTEYGLRLLTDGDSVLESSGVRLEPGQTWETTTRLGPASVEADVVEAVVYRAEDPAVPYRRVVLRRAELKE